MEARRYYSAEEVCRGVIVEIGENIFSRQLLQNLRAARKIEYTKIGGKCYYTKDALIRYIERNTTKCL